MRSTRAHRALTGHWAGSTSSVHRRALLSEPLSGIELLPRPRRPPGSPPRSKGRPFGPLAAKPHAPDTQPSTRIPRSLSRGPEWPPRLPKDSRRRLLGLGRSRTSSLSGRRASRLCSRALSKARRSPKRPSCSQAARHPYLRSLPCPSRLLLPRRCLRRLGLLWPVSER